jgi:hypothetical protein
MNLLYLYLGTFLILPIIGEIVIYMRGITISAGEVELSLIINNIIFLLIIFLTTSLILNYKLKSFKINEYFKYSYSNLILKRIMFILFLITLFIFVTSGYDFLFKSIARGDTRVSLGFIGPFYTVFLNYVPILLITYASIIYVYSFNRNKLRNKLYLCFLFLLIIGIFSGYKATAISLMIPGFVILYYKSFNFKRLSFFILITLIVLTLFTSLVRDIPITNSFNFLIYRLTTMNAYGTIGAWGQFDNSISLNDFGIYSTSVFGHKLSSYILNVSEQDVLFLKTSLSRFVTYLVYPDTEGALAGTVNVTVTNFGDAIYLFGKQLYVVYALFIGMVIGITLRLFKKYMQRRLPLKLSMISVYFFSVIIPSINSSGLIGLFSLPVIVNLIITYVIGRYFIQIRRYKYE